MSEANPAELEILPNPLMKLQPLALGMFAVFGGMAASLIPNIVGRIAAGAFIIGMIAHIHLTTVRRLVVGDDAVNIELSRKRARIAYSNLEFVTVRAVPLRGVLIVNFAIKDPPTQITTRTGLMYDEVHKIAPRLIRALIIRGVDVRVPGRPDVGTG